MPPVRLYDVSVGGQRVKDLGLQSEYDRTVEVSSAPDTFACGHILCHKCIRNHLVPRRGSVWECPVCNEVSDSFNLTESTGSGTEDDDSQHIKLMSNYDQMVEKFNGIDYSLRRLKDEKVEAKSVGLSYTTCPCSMCGENHGTLSVTQEYNQLRVQHVRPTSIDHYFYRLSTGSIVTSFYSVVNSSCVCVPCTYKEIHARPQDFPAITNNNLKGSPESALAEVGKVVTSNNAPIESLQGKSVIEIDHNISVKERADLFTFSSTAAMIKRLVRREEQNLDLLIKKSPKIFQDAVIQGMLEFEWDLFIDAKKKALRGETWTFEEKAICFSNGMLIGGGGPDDFVIWAEDNFNFEEFRPLPLYETLMEEAYLTHLSSKNHDYVYLDVSIGEEPAGRLVIELFSDIVPRTCENFKALCTGEKGKSESDYTLHYLNTLFHRIVRKGWIQGGDIYHGRGNGGESIFGYVFEDENFAVPHSRRGMVGMANKGRHTNGSQFYITLEPTQWMDTKYVAFGQVIEGTQTLKKMEEQETMNERPRKDIKITDCGVLKFQF
ncbi:uncharacterized protein LOC134257913 [Saccostrea cucullata]|uniref:uncharacterized protein LOC134257913 n=1 Tax=Saccostrea cuccullata TaxID=36930 RepID=UPI002ED3967C